jgi:hypothetical protein
MTNQNPPTLAPAPTRTPTVPTVPAKPELPGVAVVVGGKIKNILQIVIAISIVGILILKLLFVVRWDLFGVLSAEWFVHIKPLFIELKTLEIVAKALAYSAGIDLAYMLLTPGPDEAIEPLILGLASAILFSISSIGEINIKLALEIGIYVLILAGLFVLKARFIKDITSQNKPGVINLSLVNVKAMIKDMKKAKTLSKEIMKMLRP